MSRTKDVAMDVLAVVLLAALGLLNSGCDQKHADTGEGEAEAALEESIRTREALLEAREKALIDREAELEQKNAAILERLDAVEKELQAEVSEATPEIATVPAAPPPVTDTRETLPVRPRRIPEPEPTKRTVWYGLPAGTVLPVRFTEYHSSGTDLPGDPITATVTRDVALEGIVVIPAGSRVAGRVVEAVPGKKIGGKARLAVRFETLELPSGEEIPVQVGLAWEGKSQVKKDAATIGGSVAGGAVLGTILGGDDRDKGAVLGAVLGAAVGTAVATKNAGDPVVVEPGTPADLVLETPVEIAVEEEVISS